MSWFNVVLLNLCLVNLCVNIEIFLFVIIILFFFLNLGLFLVVFVLVFYMDGFRVCYVFWGWMCDKFKNVEGGYICFVIFSLCVVLIWDMVDMFWLFLWGKLWYVGRLYIVCFVSFWGFFYCVMGLDLICF